MAIDDRESLRRAGQGFPYCRSPCARGAAIRVSMLLKVVINRENVRISISCGGECLALYLRSELCAV